MISTLVQDLRYAARGLAQKPAIVLVATLSLGLGAGFNTTLFGLLNTLLLQPPTATAPAALVRIEPGNGNLISFPNLRDLEAAGVISEYGGFTTTRANLGRELRVDRALVMVATANLFHLLGVQPAIGRVFDADANAPLQDSHVALLSDRTWRRQFGADPGILGRDVSLNGQAFRLIGVLAPDYRPLTGSLQPDLYVPVSAAIAPALDERRTPMLTLVARLVRGTSAAQARAAFMETSRALEAAYPAANKDFSKPAFIAPVAGLGSLQSRAAPSGIYALVAAPFVLVGLVLMIACANVAGVLLARGLGRRREVGIRLALGASRRHVIQMLMAESFLLSVAGSAVGLTLALWLTSLVARLRLPGMAEPLDVTALVDRRFAFYFVGLIIVTTFVTGFLPAWQSVRHDLVTGLKSEAGGGATRRLSLRRGLVVGQTAVSAVLMIFSFMLVRSFWRVASASPGFDVDAGVVANLDLDPARYPPAEARLLAEQLMDRAERLPGVTAASVSNIVPLSGDSNIAYPQSDSSPDVNGPETNVTNVGPNYFRVMGIPLVRGREFTKADRVGSMPVVVINEALAARFFIGRDPLGHRVRLNGTAPYHEIVGVVRNSKYQFLSESPRPLIYLPYLETGGRLILQVRTEGDVGDVMPEVRGLIAGLDRMLVPDVRALRDVASQEIIMRRLGAALLALLGGVGLVLAVVGLYGLMTHHVTERTLELSIRLALGAPRGGILWNVVGDGLRLTALGTLIAFSVAIVATRPLTFLLAGVSAADPGVIAGISALFAAISTLACLGPGTRAMKVDLLTLLRRE